MAALNSYHLNLARLPRDLARCDMLSGNRSVDSIGQMFAILSKLVELAVLLQLVGAWTRLRTCEGLSRDAIRPSSIVIP
jgi:hypothetical protein